MKTSEQINEIAKALSGFQGELPNIEKSTTVKVKTNNGSSYTFNYAPLDVILQSIKPLLQKYELSFIHSMNGNVLECIILHSSGQRINTGGITINFSNKMQDMGSSMTYARRYTLCSAFGIVAEDDDDGNASDGNKVEEIDTKEWLNKGETWNKIVKRIKAGTATIEDIEAHYKISKKNRKELEDIENAAWDVKLDNGVVTIPSADNPR